MTISIVLPEGKDVKSGQFTQVFTEDGIEITGVCHITIEIGPEEVIMATMQVCVGEIKNAEGIAALLPPSEAKKVIEWARKQSSTATEG
jgi:hypothetical protein